jgi:hypothetical protein
MDPNSRRILARTAAEDKLTGDGQVNTAWY